MSPNIELGTRVGPKPRISTIHPQVRMITDTPVKLVYDFIIRYKSSHDGNSPTIREIGEACDISSTSVVTYWLKRLESRGLIRRPEPQFGNRFAASIEVIGGKWEMEKK